MKQFALLIILIVGYFSCNAQLYDAQWTIGYEPVATLDFRNDTVVLDTLAQYNLLFNLTNADICDEQGNLLYVTNGIYICNKNGDTLLNGNGINPCDYTEDWACCGLDIPQAALFLPKPGNARYYYLFHFSDDAQDSTRPSIIYYSVIDKEGNGGLGAVIKKNIPVIEGVNFREGGMTACKHANGRDYWIVMGGYNNNTFYTLLLTPDTVLGPFVQSIGPYFLPPYDVAYSKFSQDGSKFATGIYDGPVAVMDFDRCSGLFSNSDTIFNQACFPPSSSSSCDGSSGVEFSPNGRFLYVAAHFTLNQYDLWSGNIQDSVELYQNYNSEPGLDMIQVAPNGKIYISTWNGIVGFDSIHVINNPNAKGDSCNFVYGGQPMVWAANLSLPNMINYRLGALEGSGCDTLTDIRQQTLDTRLMQIQPNPAEDYVAVKISTIGDYEVQLLNEVGQVLDSKQINQSGIFITAGLASGLYFLKATPKSPNGDFNTGVITKKVVVVH